ncbi:hypothetical protein Bhyg_12570, partial [Pseudolycoriella hygida]
MKFNCSLTEKNYKKNYKKFPSVKLTLILLELNILATTTLIRAKAPTQTNDNKLRVEVFYMQQTHSSIGKEVAKFQR